LSSAILYLAIVAIWAVVLVPRWLRPRSAAPKPVPVPAESPDAGWREPAGPGQDAGAPLAVSTDGPDAAGEPVGGEVMASSDAGGEAVADVAQEGAAEAVGPSPVNRRAEVLKARRRLLSTLITLTVIAVALVVTRIDAYWIVIPPIALLGGYLALLRKFAHIDAERARSAARIRGAEARTETGQEPAAPSAPLPAAPTAAEPELGSAPDAPQPLGGAEIIDISGRIGDQVYDQYADAANRAVGD
jgi:hypothetical protein